MLQQKLWPPLLPRGEQTQVSKIIAHFYISAPKPYSPPYNMPILYSSSTFASFVFLFYPLHFQFRFTTTNIYVHTCTSQKIYTGENGVVEPSAMPMNETTS
jgi:hypothetical protein